MLRLLGEYDVSLDAKGRFLLPAAFRKQLPKSSGERFVINRGFEKCLTLYPIERWDEVAEKVYKFNDFDAKVREFKRLFLNGASHVEADSAGRLLVPKRLLEYANIKKDVVFMAQGNKVELWDSETYDKYMASRYDNFSDLADEVAGNSSINPFEGL